jgi:hypothetical protein
LSRTGLTAPAYAGSLARTLGRTSDTPVQASFRSGCIPRLQVVVASLQPRAKPAAQSRIAGVKRFLRFADTVQDHGRDQGTSSPRSRDLQVTSSKPARATLLAWQGLQEALVSQLHSAASAPEAAAHPSWLHQRNPVFAPATVRPNPSLKLTRYGRRCKPGPRPLRHHREPGLQRLPPRAA